MWDGENRLTRIETRTNAVTDSNYWQRLDCTYDYQSRRVRKQASTWNPGIGSYQLSTSLRFFYDGWNLVGQVDEVTGTRLSFVWGTDLSGTMQGAGGVGGLKALIVHNGTNAGTYFYSYDGNGNVAALINAADGSEAARYEYGPFLELLRASGPLARLNPFRASTKYQDDETQLLYYGFRYCRVSTGRWLSQDPLGALGGPNLFVFTDNDSVQVIDPFGVYQEGGHYYTTYIGAVISGKRELALALAFYSQLPDELASLTAYNTFGTTAPKAVGNSLTFGNAAQGFDALQRLLHSLDGGIATPRRDCLRKLLQDPALQPWESGMLIHAFADSYAHSFVDPNRFLGTPGFSYVPAAPIPNPNFGKEIMYEAPFGHGKVGSTPDFVSQRPQLYGQYLTDLITTLNAGPLQASQEARLQDVLSQVKRFPKGLIGQAEISAFRNIAVQSFGYPQNGYRPERFEALSAKDFLAGPGNGLGFKLPTELEVNVLLNKIKKACCKP